MINGLLKSPFIICCLITVLFDWIHYDALISFVYIKFKHRVAILNTKRHDAAFKIILF